MEHKVNNVQLLYDDAVNLYNKVVKTNADNIINDLGDSITYLKESWEGKDAGVQIQNVIVVYNAMVTLRNVLAKLAKDASFVASNYRDIQNANGANLESLLPITIEEKPALADYYDGRDSIYITQTAEKGKEKINSASIAIDGFITDVHKYYDSIITNWQVGTGRGNAEQAFFDFLNKSAKYKNTLENVALSITEALKKYI